MEDEMRDQRRPNPFPRRKNGSLRESMKGYYGLSRFNTRSSVFLVVKAYPFLTLSSRIADGAISPCAVHS
jgi:hypothetical protein